MRCRGETDARKPVTVANEVAASEKHLQAESPATQTGAGIFAMKVINRPSYWKSTRYRVNLNLLAIILT